MRNQKIVLYVGALFLLLGVGVSLATGQSFRNNDSPAGVLALIGVVLLFVAVV